MKNDTLITSTDRRFNGWRGYVESEHPNLSGFYWCRIAPAAPFPYPHGPRLKHHEPRVLPLSALQADTP